MGNHIIRRIMMRITTKEQLLNFLNKMKEDEAVSNGNAKYYPFEIKQINYYCNPDNKGRYRQFIIPKKSGGERTISSPNHSLKNILYYVNEIFKAFYRPNQYACGFVEGKSIVDNAKKHNGKNYVFNIDLSDFFTSVDQARVWGRLKAKPYCFKQSMASIIAGLCAMKMVMPDGRIRYVLPQGAPTSPILTNMICERLDNLLGHLASKYKVDYSRYADDMTFSSMHNVYQKGSDFRKELREIIEGQGFKINDKKTRLDIRGFRQEVTGLTVGVKPNVTRSYVKNIRAILHIWEKFGHDEAQKRFFPYYVKSNKNKKVKGEPHVENVIEGKLLFMKMVKGEDDTTFAKLWSRYKRLIGDNKPLPPKGKVTQQKSNTNNLTINVLCHYPKRVVEFLSNFTKADSVLKYTTHTWDTGVVKSFESFVEKYKEELETNDFWRHGFYDCQPELYYIIRNFLLSDNMVENRWGRYHLRIGYLCPKGYMNNWMNANPGKQPSEMPLNILPKEYVPPKEETGGEALVNFDQVINIFKESIEFRGNNFYDMVRRVFHRPDIDLDRSEMNSLRGYSFYSNTYKIEQTIKQILENIISRPIGNGVKHHIKIWAKCNEDNTQLCLHILDVGSFSDANPATDKKLMLAGKGNMLNIVNNLSSLCDFYVESRFRKEEGTLKHGIISYLYAVPNGRPKPKTTWCSDDKALGFDYILKFYLS